ncbi:MAG: molybdopterin cofactor-binding domain-containing protein [Acidimicrobiales bacterium]
MFWPCPPPHGGDITLYSSSQIPHILKVKDAVTTGLPEQKLRIIAPAVGRSGAKLNVNPDELLAVTLANKLGVAVRWTETRSEAALNASGLRPASDNRNRRPTPMGRYSAFGCISTPIWAPT